MSLWAQGIKAAHNGVRVDQLCQHSRYAPNAYMRDWYEQLAEAQIFGIELRPGGRWLSPVQIREALQ
jgi:hypothetical protein